MFDFGGGFCLFALCKVLLGALDGNSNVEALCFGILKGQVFLQTEVYSHFIPPHRRRNILLYYVMPIPVVGEAGIDLELGLSSLKLGFDFLSKYFQKIMF